METEKRTNNTDIVKALKLAYDCIMDSAKVAGPMGAPSGVIYAVLMSHGMTLSLFENIVDAMVHNGVIVVEHNCIKLA